jgi:hypothetical protein
MSLRPIRFAAGLLITSLAFGVAPAAPALADGIIAPPARHHVRQHVRHHWHAPRVIERVRVVPRIVYVPQPVYSGCGGCGTRVAYAPPPVQYSGSCGGCGYGVAQTGYYSGYSGYSGNYYSGAGYVGTSQYADDEEYAPAYTTGYSTGYSTGYIGRGYVGRGYVGRGYGGRGYIGGGYIRPRLGFSTRFVGNRVGFRAGFTNRSSFYGRRPARFR